MLIEIAREPYDMKDLIDQLYRNREYKAYEFIKAEMQKSKEYEVEKDLLERRADELAYGMTSILNLVRDMQHQIENAPRINRKEVIDWLKELEQSFDEYI